MKEINRLSDELVQVLSNKRKSLIGILNFTQLQTNAIDEKDDDRLSEYINEKQKFIDDINKLDEYFVGRFNLLKSTLGVKSLDEIPDAAKQPLKQVKFELDGVNMLIEQIYMIEKENSTKIKKEYDDIKSKLKEINNGKNAISAYGAKPSSIGGAFVDSKK